MVEPIAEKNAYPAKTSSNSKGIQDKNSKNIIYAANGSSLSQKESEIL